MRYFCTRSVYFCLLFFVFVFCRRSFFFFFFSLSKRASVKAWGRGSARELNILPVCRLLSPCLSEFGLVRAFLSVGGKANAYRKSSFLFIFSCAGEGVEDGERGVQNSCVLF